MSLSHAAAGRARRVDGGVFFSEHVRQRTYVEPTPTPPPYAWKRTLEDRVWSVEGPAGVSARAVLITLIRHADANGRTWIGIPTIAAKTGIGSYRTVRNALEALARQGWLQVLPQTWASLTAEQTAAGRPAPRRGDDGQAPNLYVVLDGRGTPVMSEAPTAPSASARPGLARIAAKAEPTPGQNGQGGPGRNGQGEPLADLHCDLDPKGSGSRKECGERATRPETGTHILLKSGEGDCTLADAWELLVSAHAETTRTKFGLTPSKPDVKLEQRQAMAEGLKNAAAEVRARLRQGGIERDVVDLQRELATRVMRLYFKHDSEHLKRVKWALRDLSREMDARLIEAMQQLVRENREAMSAPRVLADKPAPLVRAIPVESLRAPPVDNAREAQRIIAMLEGSRSDGRVRA